MIWFLDRNMVNSNSSLDFMLPVKRTTTAAALGVDSESSSLKKQRGLASGTAVTYTINMAGGSSNGSNCATNDKSPMSDGQPLEIDEDLHSRQLAVYGRETMRRLFASNILISGVQGLGSEIGRSDLRVLWIVATLCVRCQSVGYMAYSFMKYVYVCHLNVYAVTG